MSETIEEKFRRLKSLLKELEDEVELELIRLNYDKNA